MKIILLRDTGVNFTFRASRMLLGITAGVLAVTFCTFVGIVAYPSSTPHIEAEVVTQWRDKLSSQQEVVLSLEQKSQAQNAAIGRQLAQMSARLLRMEAVGAHMAESANLDAEEFDFTNPPAQGGPIEGTQRAWSMAELSLELSTLGEQIRQREQELSILGSVLVHEEFEETSQVRGRPVNWGWMSSPYGNRVDPLSGKTAWHAGVDFAGKEGSDVIAVASGVVTFSGKRSGYGKTVEISHANGVVTRYAHHKELLVNTGDVVKKGDPIGKMGSSGRSTGPHVHFEVEKGGRRVDPAAFVAKRS